MSNKKSQKSAIGKAAEQLRNANDALHEARRLHQGVVAERDALRSENEILLRACKYALRITQMLPATEETLTLDLKLRDVIAQAEPEREPDPAIFEEPSEWVAEGQA